MEARKSSGAVETRADRKRLSHRLPRARTDRSSNSAWGQSYDEASLRPLVYGGSVCDVGRRISTPLGCSSSWERISEASGGLFSHDPAWITPMESSHPKPSLAVQSQELIQKLDRATHLPPRELEQEVDQIQRDLVRLRDNFIGDAAPRHRRYRRSPTRDSTG